MINKGMKALIKGKSTNRRKEKKVGRRAIPQLTEASLWRTPCI